MNLKNEFLFIYESEVIDFFVDSERLISLVGSGMPFQDYLSNEQF
jgi:hypothetical protein